MWTLTGPMVNCTNAARTAGKDTGGFMDTNTTRSEPLPNFAVVRTTGRIVAKHMFHADDWLSAVEKAREEAMKFDQWRGHTFVLADYPVPVNRHLVFDL